MARCNFASLLVLLALASTCLSYTFYVSPDGSGNCVSSSPCSLETAVSLLNNTDTVQLLAGTYNVENTAVIRSEAVTMQGEAGVVLDCAATCFSFEKYPFSVRNMTMRSTSNSTVPGTFIVSFNSTTNNVSGATDSVIEGVVAELNDSNFLYAKYQYGGLDAGISFSLIDVSISGMAGTINESPLYMYAIGTSGSLELTDVTFTSLTTSCDAPLLDTGFSLQTLSLESVSVVDSNISSFLNAGGVDAIFTDVSFSNITTYNAPNGTANNPIIDLNSFNSLTVNGLFFESVSDERGLMFAYGATTVVNNVVVDNCVGPDDTIALNYASGTSAPASINLTDITFSSSSYGMGLYLLESESLMTTVSVSGLTVTDVTTNTWSFISASNCNFTLSDFTVSKCTFEGGVVDLPGIGSSSVSDGSVSEVDASGRSIFSNFYGYDSVEGTVYDVEFKNITFYDVEGYSLIRVTPSNGTWTIAVEDCDIDTGSIVDVVVCDNQDGESGSAVVDVTSSSCDVTNGCGMTGYGYDDGSSVCVITLDEESVCCDSVDANGNPIDTDDGPVGWLIFAIVAVVVCCIMLAVVGIIGAGLFVLKKRKQETYDSI